MGRPASTTSTSTTVHLQMAPEMKKRASIAAIRAGITLSDLVARALVAYLAPKPRQGSLPLDESHD